jgi:hypothetical protein
MKIYFEAREENIPFILKFVVFQGLELLQKKKYF